MGEIEEADSRALVGSTARRMDAARHGARSQLKEVFKDPAEMLKRFSAPRPATWQVLSLEAVEAQR